MHQPSLRSSLLAITVVLALTACSREASAPQTATSQPDNNAADSTKPATAGPVTSGVDQTGMDKNVKPGDDFNGYANGGWEKTTEIPADRSNTGIFYQVFEKAEQRTSDLIKQLAGSNPAAGSNERKIADFYSAYMDETAIEKAGLAPVQAQLDAIDGITDVAGLSRYLGSTLRADVDPLNATNFHTDHLFGLFVAQGLEDPEHNTAYLMQGGLAMPDREYYLAEDKAMAANRSKYLQYITDTLQRSGIDAKVAKTKAEAILALETRIAKAHTNVVDSMDVHKANNPWAVNTFAVKAPGIDWKEYFDASGLSGQKTVTAWQPAAIRDLSALVASQPLQTWKDYLHFHAINHSANLLPRAYADAAFDFFGKTLEGTPKQRERWKRAVGATNGALGDAVGQLYVKQYFPASSKAQVEEMVKNILAAFGEGVDKLEWMTPATKEKAKAKAAAMLVGVGYPDSWRDYGSLEIKPNDAAGNALRAEQAELRHQLAKLDKPVDRKEWWMTPQTVNAVQLPLQNAMNFPAAILEAPFFDPNADAAANYGAIGAVIGHEISHGFDNTGAEFDAQGKLANWWTPEDAAHFKAAGDRLVKQYDGYEPLPGLHVNGKQTLGENIADVSGLAIAHAAWQKSLGGKPAPEIDGLTGEQRFFLAYGQAWRTKNRDAALRARLISDPHAPGTYRAQTVRNIDPWYETFQVKEGEKLYLDPKDRVKIW